MQEYIRNKCVLMLVLVPMFHSPLLELGVTLRVGGSMLAGLNVGNVDIMDQTT